MQATGSFKFHGHANPPQDEGNQSYQMKKLRSTDPLHGLFVFLILSRLRSPFIIFYRILSSISTRLDCRAFLEGEFITECVTGAGCMRKPDCFMWQTRFITWTAAAYSSGFRSAFVKKSLHLASIEDKWWVCTEEEKCTVIDFSLPKAFSKKCGSGKKM